MGDFAWVTLATNDSYSLGALVLAHSLRRVGTKHDLAVLVTPGVTGAMREKLSSIFSVVQEVNVLDSKDQANLALLARPELGITFTKLHCWRLTQYQKCVFVDADTLVIRNCDELFDREELSAAPDVGWPDCFNSGVFVFKPSQQTFASITAFAAAKGSFDGGDQGLLNQYFSDWAHKDISKHLPFIYNMCSTATYSYLPAFKQFGEDVRIIHFIGITKPWLQYFDTLTGQVQPAPGSNHLQPLLQLWWNIFCENVHPQLTPVMTTSTLAPLWHEHKSSPTFSEDPTNFPSFVDNARDPDFSEFKDPWENYKRQTDLNANEGNDSRSNQVHNDNRSNNNKQKVVCKNGSPQYSTILDDYLTEQNSSSFHFTQNEHPMDERYGTNGDQYKLSSVLENSRQDETRDNSQSFHGQIEHRRSSTDKNHYLYNFHEKETNHSSNNFKELETSLPEQNSSSHERVNPNETNRIVHDEQTHRRNDEINQQHFCEEHYHRDEQISSSNLHCGDTQSSSLVENHSVSVTSFKPDEKRLQDQCKIEPRVEQIDTYDEFSQSHPSPCTKSKRVTTQSESKIARQPNSNDAGIAGALAQITLGEARSPEQVAFEEHMRKQSWEQGQIDYMGRDSFENIWKKISETLAIQSGREPSPPKTMPKVTTKKETEVATTPAIEDEPAAKSEAAVLAEQRQREEQDPISELVIEVEKLIPSLPEVTQREIILETQSTVSEAAASPKNKNCPSIPIASKDSSISGVSQSVELEEKFQEKRGIPVAVVELEKSVDKEVTRTPEVAGVESPVPIQVAESVLEADVKESVTEDLRPVSEEAISTISLTAQESVPAVSESVMEAVEPSISTPNGSATLGLEIGNGIDGLSISCPVRVTTAIVESRSLQTIEPPRTEEPVPVVVPAQASQETLPTSQQQESCSLPLRGLRETETQKTQVCGAAVELAGKSQEALLPADQSAMALPAVSEKSQETTSPAEIKTEEQQSTGVQETSTSLVESKVNVETPEASTEAQQLPVEPTEKIQESKTSLETQEISQPLSEPVDKSQELPAQVQSSSAQPMEQPEETKLPVKSADPSLLSKTEKSSLPSPESSKKPEFVDSQEKKVKPVVCPIKPARIEMPELLIKADKSVLPLEREESVEVEAEEIASQSESSEESPVRPTRTKDTQIPSTPTITEATPPTSPPIGPIEPLDPQQATKSTKKVVKKVVKKTTETKPVETETEPDVKKVSKKVVKKVVKKKEDDVSAEGTSGNDKPKKVVKVVKKTTKTSSSLDAETTVPETPPPGTSEIPVPPKRKPKTNAKTTKSDSEP